MKFALLLVLAASAWSQVYFPHGRLSEKPYVDQFTIDWYSRILRALQEPSLTELAESNRQTVSYRVTWIPTFEPPICVRVDIHPDGTARLFFKNTSGQGGYDPGNLAMNRTWTLKPKQVRALLSEVESTKFWITPVHPPPDQQLLQLDGAVWVVEGVRDGEYHLLDRVRQKGDPAIALGLMMMFDLAFLDRPKKDLY